MVPGIGKGRGGDRIQGKRSGVDNQPTPLLVFAEV